MKQALTNILAALDNLACKMFRKPEPVTFITKPNTTEYLFLSTLTIKGVVVSVGVHGEYSAPDKNYSGGFDILRVWEESDYMFTNIHETLTLGQCVFLEDTGFKIGFARNSVKP